MAVTGGLLDAVAAVVVLLGKPVLEHHKRRNNVGALNVRNIRAFDAKRRLVHAQRLLDILQSLRAGSEVAHSLELVLVQRLRRVLVHGLHQRPLVAALRHADVDGPAAKFRQQFRNLRQFRRQRLHENLAGHRHRRLRLRARFLVDTAAAHLLRLDLTVFFLLKAHPLNGIRVVLHEKVLHQGGQGRICLTFVKALGGARLVAGFLDHPAALRLDAAVPNIEDLYRGLKLVGVERDDVGVGVLAQHHRLALHDLVHRPQVVAQPRRALELQVLRCLGHLRGDAAH